MARNKKTVAEVVYDVAATTSTAVEASTEEDVKGETTNIEPTESVEASSGQTIKAEAANAELEDVEASTEDNVKTEAAKVEPTESIEASTKETANSEPAESVEDSSDEDIDLLAQKLMEDNRVKEIWRCPLKGYWFTREDYANDRAKTIGKPLIHFTLK